VSTCFNGHPPLGVNATGSARYLHAVPARSFNGHPPLGVNAIVTGDPDARTILYAFQWAPTLGGECYPLPRAALGAGVRTVSMGTHP